MIELSAPAWPLAVAFVALGVGFVVALKAHLRGAELWRYDTLAAWLRAFAYFSFAWALAAASGTLTTIRDNPVVFPGQTSNLLWWIATVAVVAVILFGYVYYWPRGTKPHGRRIVFPDTPVFGLVWGVSEGLLFGSVWVLAVRLFGATGDASSVLKEIGVAVVTILVLSAFIGLWHALYWDVHVSPEHNIVEFNMLKVLYAHNPNVVLSTVYVTVYENLAIFVALQAFALFASSLAMPFPSGRRPHPVDPTRPALGPPVPVGTTDMSGRTVVITGGAGGVGSVVASRLARQGADLVLVDVRGAALEKVAAEIRAETGASVATIVTDLASTPDVHRLAVELRAHHPRIDVLLNNAGRFSPRYALSDDGHELTLASNHLGHFLLTNLLLDRLQEAQARVVFVSSDAHWQAKRVDWDDMNCANAWKGKESNPNAGFAAYNQSKLILTATAMELAERTRGTGMTVNVVVPGALVPTGIYDELTGPPALFIKVMRPVLRTPEKASTGFVYLASSPEVAGVSGWYWKDVRAIDESLLAQDPALRRRLWDWSADAVGIGTPAP